MKILVSLLEARLVVALALLLVTESGSRAQTALDALEVVRHSLQADRQAVVAEAMQLTEQESSGFWAAYRTYRRQTEEVGDGLVKLVLEYADTFPSAPDEKRAAEMVKRFTELERSWTAAKAKCARRLGKVLPASKVLRFLQVENRLDLLLRLQLANAVPLVPVGSPAHLPPAVR